MTFSFDPTRGSVLVDVEITGPLLTAVVRVALDTGSRRTVVDPAQMEAIGYDLSNCLPSVQATTASGVVSVAPLMLMNLAALGHVASGFEVIVHALPPTSKVDGLLGLDFFRNRVLTLNFQKGEIALTP